MAEPHRCPHCESELSAEAPEGLCPECLFRQALADPGPGLERDAAGRSPAPGFVPPAPAELARHFPQLEILRLLGQGGMGAVYLARQPELDRLVALKVLPPEVARDPGFTERFSREARALARLSHPNIVTIFDFGTAGGLYYFTMEYVDGRNVRQLLEDGPVAPALALKVVAQVCDALHYAHDEGLVHRDIKPENLLVDGKGRVKIADFGLARLVGLTPTYLTLTGSCEVMGTLYYMAPEQLQRARAVDHRADLYSLGVVFYEMLTGELPVGRFAPPSQRAGVDARLDAIVLKALAREPEHRHQDAAEIRREIGEVLAGGAAAPDGSPAPVGIRSNVPCVRFTIPHVSWLGTWVRGEIFRDPRDETALILDFQVMSWLGTYKEPELLRIPLSEILTIACHTAGRSGEIVIKVHRPEVLAKLPVGKHGRGRLKIQRNDREAARQLVDSILRTPLPALGRRGPGLVGPVSARDHDRIRKQLIGPAVGLLVTAVLALVSTVVLAVQLARTADGLRDGVREVVVILAAAVFAMVGAGLLVLGAGTMLGKRDNYLVCATAAILAVLPWSPAWPIGLSAGAWALVVLSRPEVMAAFLDNRRLTIPDAVGVPEAPAPAAGKLGSWLRSFTRYFVTVPGKHGHLPTREAGDGKA